VPRTNGSPLVARSQHDSDLTRLCPSQYSASTALQLLQINKITTPVMSDTQPSEKPTHVHIVTLVFQTGFLFYSYCSASSRKEEYHDDRVCVFVCWCVCMSMSIPLEIQTTQFAVSVEILLTAARL